MRNAFVVVHTKAGRSENATSPKVKMRTRIAFRKAACFPTSAMASDRLLPEPPSRSQGVAKSCSSTIGWCSLSKGVGRHVFEHTHGCRRCRPHTAGIGQRGGLKEAPARTGRWCVAPRIDALKERGALAIKPTRDVACASARRSAPSPHRRRRHPQRA